MQGSQGSREVQKIKRHGRRWSDDRDEDIDELVSDKKAKNKKRRVLDENRREETDLESE